jgi:hypothetical protein
MFTTLADFLAHCRADLLPRCERLLRPDGITVAWNPARRDQVRFANGSGPHAG